MISSIVNFVNIFNSREQAVIAWIIILISFFLTKKNIRDSLKGVLQIMLSHQILIIITSAITYISLIIFLLHKSDFWNIYFDKDTVIWGLTTGFILLFGINKNKTDFFKKTIRDVFKISILLEFIMNLYTFNFFVEMLVIIPIITILALLDATADLKEEYKQAKKLVDYLLLITSIWIMALTLRGIFSNFHYYLSLSNLLEFLLPIVLTIWFLPFLYFLALFMGYESFFININLRLKDNPGLAKFIKRKIFILCFLDLNKLNSFIQTKTKDIIWVKNKKGVLKIIGNYHKDK